MKLFVEVSNHGIVQKFYKPWTGRLTETKVAKSGEYTVFFNIAQSMHDIDRSLRCIVGETSQNYIFQV